LVQPVADGHDAVFAARSRLGAHLVREGQLRGRARGECRAAAFEIRLEIGNHRWQAGCRQTGAHGRGQSGVSGLRAFGEGTRQRFHDEANEEDECE